MVILLFRLFFTRTSHPDKETSSLMRSRVIHKNWQNEFQNMLNVRGLGDKVKRREVFNWLRDKKFSIIMLQKVRCIDKNIPIYLAEWGY